MLEELIALENKVAPEIDADHFTLIAPANPATFDLFIDLAYKRIHVTNAQELMQKKSQVRKLLRTLNPEIHLDLFVIRKSESSKPERQTLEEYRAGRGRSAQA
jgi:hypothetical protein